MGERGMEQRAIHAQAPPQGKAVAGPRQAHLAALSATLNAAPPVQRLAVMAPSRARIPINDDAGLEREAEAMGAQADAAGLAAPAQLRATPAAAPSPSPPSGVMQLYVILGRERSDPSKNLLDHFGGETKKRLLTADDVGHVTKLAIEAVVEREERAGEGALTPEYVSRAKGLADYMKTHPKQVYEKLSQWVESPGELESTMIGTAAEAQWRHYDNYYELGLALGHEILPETRKNVAREEGVADVVNRSEWIEFKLREVVAAARRHMGERSYARQMLDQVESIFTGSYNLSDFRGKPGNLLKSTMGTQTTKEKITDHIKELHDIMERWSTSQAGSGAAKLHEAVGIAPILPNPEDEAMEATTLDPETSDLGEKPRVGLMRAIRLNTEEDERAAEDAIISKRMRSMVSKNAPGLLPDFTSDKARLKKVEKRQQKLMANYPGVSDHRDRDLLDAEEPDLEPSAQSMESGVRRRVRSDSSALPEPKPEPRIDTHSDVPERNMVAQMVVDHFKQQREEADSARRKQAKPGKVNKTSKAKGRKNVGTRDEMDPDTLLSRLFSAPIWAGRSMTTARMMRLVEILGGDESHKTAVAYALFAFWRRTYNKGLTPIHTFHETMDVARNFGVSYEPFHYPEEEEEGGDIDYMAPRIAPMTGAPRGPKPREELRREEPSSGLRRVNQVPKGKEEEERRAPPSSQGKPSGKKKWD